MPSEDGRVCARRPHPRVPAPALRLEQHPLDVALRARCRRRAAVEVRDEHACAARAARGWAGCLCHTDTAHRMSSAPSARCGHGCILCGRGASMPENCSSAPPDLCHTRCTQSQQLVSSAPRETGLGVVLCSRPVAGRPVREPKELRHGGVHFSHFSPARMLRP